MQQANASSAIDGSAAHLDGDLGGQLRPGLPARRLHAVEAVQQRRPPHAVRLLPSGQSDVSQLGTAHTDACAATLSGTQHAFCLHLRAPPAMHAQHGTASHLGRPSGGGGLLLLPRLLLLQHLLQAEGVHLGARHPAWRTWPWGPCCLLLGRACWFIWFPTRIPLLCWPLPSCCSGVHCRGASSGPVSVRVRCAQVCSSWSCCRHGCLLGHSAAGVSPQPRLYKITLQECQRWLPDTELKHTVSEMRTEQVLADLCIDKTPYLQGRHDGIIIFRPFWQCTDMLLDDAHRAVELERVVCRQLQRPNSCQSAQRPPATRRHHC
jgi:hypothetical protein